MTFVMNLAQERERWGHEAEQRVMAGHGAS